QRSGGSPARLDRTGAATDRNPRRAEEGAVGCLGRRGGGALQRRRGFSLLGLSKTAIRPFIEIGRSVNSKGAVSCRVWGGKSSSRNCCANGLTHNHRWITGEHGWR